MKTREAAANPALRRIQFSLGASGLAVDETAQGELVAADAQGRVFFEGPAARIWDSTTPDSSPSEQSPSTGQQAEVDSVEETIDATEEPLEAEGVRLPIDVSGQAITVSPPQELLTGAGVTYPVVVDPGISRNRVRTYWKMVWDDGQDFDNHPTEHARVGFDDWEDHKKSRVYYQFDMREFAGKHILSAEFSHKQIHSPSFSCGGSSPPAVLLGRTAAATNATEWPGPTWFQTISSNSATRGHRDTCPNNIIQEWDAEAGVEAVATARASSITLGLRSADEGDKWGWRQYDNDATYPALRVVYNSVPNQPTSVKIAEPASSCSPSSTTPSIISDSTPVFQGYLTDTDGASSEMKARFEIYTASGTTPYWQYLTPTEYKSSALVKVTSGGLPNNTIFRFRVRAEESIASTPTEPADFGPYSGYCYFKVDTTRPSPPVVTSAEYPMWDGSENSYGGVSQFGNFTIDGGADTTAYVYWLNGRSPVTKTPASPGAPVTISLWPDQYGINTLHAQAKDGAGNTSTTYDYEFNVARGTAPTSVWALDETSGTTAQDTNSGPNHRPMTVANVGTGAGWSAQGRVGRSLLLDGVDDYAVTQAAAVSTSNSFTVAAWVRLDSTVDNATVARQAHNGHHSFLLFYSKSANRWAFRRQSPNDPAVASTAQSTTVPAVGTWTHLAGVYDGSTSRLSLYVNGVLEGTASFGTPWHVTDPFEIGRWSYPGLTGVTFKGRIDNVQLWNRFVAAREVRELANPADLVREELEIALASSWNFSDASGTTSPDASGYGAPLTLGPGASWKSDPERGQVLHVNSTLDGYAKTANGTPVIDGKGSFTITGWVRPNSSSYRGNVVSQGSHGAGPGTDKRSYGLGIARSNPARWRFDRLNAAWTSTTTVDSDVVLEPDDYGPNSEWVHIAAVYDRGTHEVDDRLVADRMHLYINGVHQQVDAGVSFPSPWHGATGPVWVGGELIGTGATTTFEGDIDDVRLYAGAMAPDQIFEQGHAEP